MLRRLALAHAARASKAHLQIKIHGIYLHALPARAKRAKWTTFTPPAATLRRRYRGLILHRRSHRAASTIWPPIARYPASRSCCSNACINASSVPLAVLQAPIFDGLSFDPFTLFDDGWGPAEVGIGGVALIAQNSQ